MVITETGANSCAPKNDLDDLTVRVPRCCPRKVHVKYLAGLQM
jgi:hypothetical protein